ncbi:MAG: hypothetical protein F4Y03_12415 [Alphaproteobacteria bacterium]|nr:hypothetical protein [Alphaproteobacteria bacterium]
MPGPEAWQAFGGALTVLIFLGTGAFALKRLGLVGGPKSAPAAPAADSKLEGRVAELERKYNDFRLCVAEHYVRRDDYIASQSRIIGLLEHHSQMLARLEERIAQR